MSRTALKYQPYTERNMEDCTFTPKINEEHLVSDSQDSAKLVNGFSKAVRRVRIAAEDKKEIKDKIEKSVRGGGYEEILKKSIKPFELTKYGKKPKEFPLVIVEVNIRPGKIIKIALYSGDNPEKIADNFMKIYQLSKPNRDKLLAVLQNYLNTQIIQSSIN